MASAPDDPFEKPGRLTNSETMEGSSKARYQALVETVSDWIWEVDARGIYTYSSPQIRNLLGYEPEEVLGKTPFDLMPPHEAHRVAKVFEHCLENALPFPALENVNLHKDGHQVYLETSGVPVFDGGGRLTGYRGVDRDITERRTLESALMRAEQEKRLILDSLSETIIYTDRDLKILWLNKAAYASLGQTREELIGRHCYSLWGPGDKPCTECALMKAFQTGRTCQIERQWPAGRFWFNQGHPVWGENGNIVGGIEVCLDITERKRAEEALGASEQRYRDFISHGTEGVWRIEFNPPIPVDLTEDEQIKRIFRDGFLAECNDAYARSMGRSRAGELTGVRVSDLVSPSDPRVIEQIKMGIRRGHTAFSIENQSIDGHGQPAFFIRSHIPIVQDEKLLRVWGISRDITPLKRAEQALLDSERRYRALFESAGDAILLMKGDRYVDCNRKALEMFGGTAEQVVGQVPHALSPLRQPGGELSEKAANDKIALAMEGQIQRFDWQYRRLDGTLLDVEVTLNRVDLAGEYYLLAIVKDLSERKRLQEQLWQSQKMEAVGRLAGGVAHDFNNLLTVINGYSEILLLSSGEIDQGLLQYVREIKTAAEKATTLTRQMLAFSRRQVLAPKVLDLNQVISNLERMLKRLIGEDVELVTLLQPGLGRVKADPGQIEQVIVNLVVNSRDAMPRGGKLTIATQDVVMGEDAGRFSFPISPGPYVQIAVIDTGVGMDAETLAHLFEPFYTTKELGKGTGLGLATVYGIVKQSGGYIWADSTPGGGTKLEVYLPRTEEPFREEESQESASEVSGGTETILVAEDEGGVRALIESQLSSLGYRVLLASTGEEALEISSRHEGPIHLLLTDVVMPGMSGVEVANRLAPTRPEMRILYMSGYTNDAMLRRGVQTAGTPFIHKPFTIQALGRKLRALLDVPPARRR
jgi:two-component system, cell cycle sensor histidine kinase and response regulator CckA